MLIESTVDPDKVHFDAIVKIKTKETQNGYAYETRCRLNSGTYEKMITH
jgi:hypothetical protein